MTSLVPLHALLAARLARAIADGAYRLGDNLPAAKTVAEQTGTHENTVLRAYRSLQSDGLVDLRRSRGATVTAVPDYDRLDDHLDHLLDEAARLHLSIGTLIAHIIARLT